MCCDSTTSRRRRSSLKAMKLFLGNFLGRKMSKRTMSSGGKSCFVCISTRSCLLDLANWLHDELAGFAWNIYVKTARKLFYFQIRDSLIT